MFQKCANMFANSLKRGIVAAALCRLGWLVWYLAMCFPRFDADLGLVPAIILCILIVSAISCYNSLFVVGRERAGEMWISDFGKISIWRVRVTEIIRSILNLRQRVRQGYAMEGHWKVFKCHWKSLKLKPLPKAYNKFGCHHHHHHPDV